MNDDVELYLEIDDGFKCVQFFDTDTNYPDAGDDMTNDVRTGCIPHRDKKEQ